MVFEVESERRVGAERGKRGERGRSDSGSGQTKAKSAKEGNVKERKVRVESTKSLPCGIGVRSGSREERSSVGLPVGVLDGQAEAEREGSRAEPRLDLGRRCKQGEEGGVLVAGERCVEGLGREEGRELCIRVERHSDLGRDVWNDEERRGGDELPGSIEVSRDPLRGLGRVWNLGQGLVVWLNIERCVVQAPCPSPQWGVWRGRVGGG